MRKRQKYFYDFDSKEVNVSDGFISNIQESVISLATMNILVDNSAQFRACAFRTVELSGYARFELPERRRNFGDVISKLF